MPYAARFVFMGLFACLSIGLISYLYRRMVRDVTDSKVMRIVGGGALIVVFAGGFLGRFVFRGSVTARGFAALLSLWFGLVLYTLLALLAVDLARAIHKWRDSRKQKPADAPPEHPERRLFLARVAAVAAASGGGGLGGFGVYRAFSPPNITEVPIKLPGLPRALDGFTIVQLSDTHIGPVLQTAYVDELVARANSAKPDLVAITGDLVDGSTADLGEFVARLRNLSSKYGTYFCSGNHDHYSGWGEWSEKLKGIGFNVLMNERRAIGDGDAQFDLIGVEDYGSRRIEGGYNLDHAVKGRIPDRASVLLSHQPGGFDDAVRLGIGLQLSGHTHGGQTFPGTSVASVIWGPRVAGWSREGGSQLYVSRGCGFVGPAMRLGSPSELIKIVLQPA